MQQRTNYDRTRANRRARWARAVVGGLFIVGGLSACSTGSAGPSVANVGAATSTTTKSSNGSGKPDPLAFSRCMRSHGVKNFPDPNSQGAISISGGSGSNNGLDPNSAQFQAAQKACQPLVTPSASQQAKARTDGLKFSACMRAHGIADFPDPNAQGGIAIRVKPGTDLDPTSPRNQAAQKACQSLLPGGKAASRLSTSSGGVGAP